MNNEERNARELALEHATRQAGNRNFSMHGIKASAEDIIKDAEVFRKFLMGEE